MERFKDSLGILNEEQFERIKHARILLVGLGGLGGYIANGLVRLGVERFTLVDYDRFETSNLNRQLFSTPGNVGEKKADVLRQAMKEIYPDVSIEVHDGDLASLDDAPVQNADLIIDATDHVATKLDIERLGAEFEKPVLHGGIGGWYGQLGIITPGEKLISALYGDNEKGVEETLKCPTFAPAVIGNLMVVEALKFLAGMKHALINRVLFVDLLTHDYDILFDTE